MRNELKPASIGSISHGTLRTEDLLESLANELEWQISRNGAFFCLPENFAERDRLNRIHGEALDCWNEAGDGIAEDKEDDASEIVNEDLPDALTFFCGPYRYFGTHCGDGSDFGFWPDMDAIGELPHVQDSDEAIELGEDCQFVNDRGNVTVFGPDGSTLLDIV